MNKLNHNIANGHGLNFDDSEASQSESSENLLQEMAKSYRSILHNVGEDPYREGLLKTPERAAKAMQYFTKGYRESLKGDRLFKV